MHDFTLDRDTVRQINRMRTAPPGITIAVPNWNHEYVLPRSIRSALCAVAELRKHGVSAEILVVDDSSRDGSLTLLRQLEALYFEDGMRVLALPINTGMPAAARNQALWNAMYRHITFLDADNELIPENLWHFYRSALQTRAAVVYGNLIRIGQDPEDVGLVCNESFQDRIFVANYIDTFAVVDRMQLLDVGGYLDNPIILAREDWELYLHLAANGRRVIFVPMVMGNYYELQASLTKETNQVSVHGEQHAYIRRVYNQFGLRPGNLLNTRHLRYHPDVGYI